MKIFNGRAATEEYMSTHTLTFSTPEMTLKKFAIWLGEQVKGRENKEEIPRLILYLEDKDSGGKKDSDLMPNVDDTFKPSGAVTEMYSRMPPSVDDDDDDATSPTGTSVNEKTLKPETKFCIECGFKLRLNSKFCTKCGAKQEQ